MALGSYVASNKRLLVATFFHVKHLKWEPEGVHGQLAGCNRNLRPKAAVAKVFHDKDGPLIPYVQITTHLYIRMYKYPRPIQNIGSHRRTKEKKHEFLG